MRIGISPPGRGGSLDWARELVVDTETETVRLLTSRIAPSAVVKDGGVPSHQARGIEQSDRRAREVRRSRAFFSSPPFCLSSPPYYQTLHTPKSQMRATSLHTIRPGARPPTSPPQTSLPQTLPERTCERDDVPGWGDRRGGSRDRSAICKPTFCTRRSGPSPPLSPPPPIEALLGMFLEGFPQPLGEGRRREE